MNESRKESASYSQNYYEYLVEQKGTKAIIIRRLLVVLLTVALLLGSAFLVLKYIPQLGAVFIILIVILDWYLWRFCSIEYEYVIAKGELEMDAVYGKRQRKTLINTKIRDMEMIAPAEQRYLDQAKRNEASRIIDASSGKNDPNKYFCIFTDKKTSRKTMLYFSATNKAVSMLRYYNPGATVVSDNLTI